LWVPFAHAEEPVVGVVTDRDLWIALATRNRLASKLRVGEIATRTPVTCDPDDDIHMALDTMRRHRIWRVPVVGFGNTILGLVSIEDDVRAARPRRIVSNERPGRRDVAGHLPIHGDSHIVAV
jgi:signal-transduction protein with cAMP-binding, CBS, and nucleotidyltransferase domain